MLPAQRRAGHAVAKQGGHVCLSCRLKVQHQQRRHNSQADAGSLPHRNDSIIEKAGDNRYAGFLGSRFRVRRESSIRRRRLEAVLHNPFHEVSESEEADSFCIKTDPCTGPDKTEVTPLGKQNVTDASKSGPPIRIHPVRQKLRLRRLDSEVPVHLAVRRFARRPRSERTFNVERERVAEIRARDEECRAFDAALDSHLGGATQVVRKLFGFDSRTAMHSTIAQFQQALRSGLEAHGISLPDFYQDKDGSSILNGERLDEKTRWCMSTLESLYQIRREDFSAPTADKLRNIARPAVQKRSRKERRKYGFLGNRTPGILRRRRSAKRPLDSESYVTDADTSFMNFLRRRSPVRRGSVERSKSQFRIHLTPSATKLPPSGFFAWQSRQQVPSARLINRHSRAFHSTRYRPQAEATEASYMSPYAQPPPDMSADPNYHAPREKLESPSGIRAQLRRWQELHGTDDSYPTKPVDFDESNNGPSNTLTRLGENDTRRRDAAEDVEDQQEAMMEFTNAKIDELSGNQLDPRFLKQGDLCEIEFPTSERESIIAVFVQRIQDMAQFYTIQGRWMHMEEKRVQYAVPGVITPDMLAPLIQYLPTAERMINREHLDQLAYVEDMSVPRRVSSPVIDRLVRFQHESDEIYRRHASTLDNAHDVLAHDKDLRYGSLVSAATTLLRITADKVTPAVLFTVRKSLMRAGYAFNIDRRSHRATGYLQIRSRDQVRMVEWVRNWMREWQDDLAAMAGKSPKAKLKHKSSRGAQIVKGFLEKCRRAILKSRETRKPTPYGNVGPSNVKLPITAEQGAVRSTQEELFTTEEEELVRFMEAWTCSNMFLGLPRIGSLPPLLLQALGLYAEEDYGFQAHTGFLFLQELGTITPYENRIRFDQHLLLPSSQHSRPLQKLMSNIMSMSQEPGFDDSMADLRHDWGQMPVFAIDAAGAHEIDDGISLERAGINSKTGKSYYWIHVHIANPTAFFGRDHALAKMARHMGESIYMPERAYMMLPSWASNRYFSLGPNRPCLTFSMKMDEDGNKVEHTIRPGRIRNVIRLTPSEVEQILGEEQTAAPSDELVMTVGGDPPPPKPHRSSLPSLTPNMIDDLKVMARIADGRSAARRAAGGVFFDMHKPEVNVWQSHRGPGLAWDHPFRKGSRITEGDPIIQYRTKPFKNWFVAKSHTSENIVRELMLLTCETSAEWCAERQIPVLFRGTLARPDRPGSEKFMREVLAPATEKNNGEYPMTLGVQYITTLGATGLSTEPLVHRTLGLNYYTKATSPLRRYGDMILHWQIEAALREEARTGKSLIATQPRTTNASQAFLPFPTQVLKTIITGLQPRESIITRAKGYSERHWVAALLFRAFHFNETPLPTQTFRAHIYNRIYDPAQDFVQVMIEELNVNGTLRAPEEVVAGIKQKRGVVSEGWAKPGDVWECKMEFVQMYRRETSFRAVRLISREEWCDML